MSLVHYAIKDRVAIVTIDNPPVNALSPGVQTRLHEYLKLALEDPQVSAVVLTGAGSNFVAGADIVHLQKCARDGNVHSLLPQLLMEIEAASKPVVAALHGNALGGGMELALAAHYRIAAPGCKLGQPEVKLGLIPGAGGTQRLPRLAGIEMALEMCAFGNPIPAEDALRFGILDQIADTDLLPAAIRLAKEAADSGALRRTRERSIAKVSPEEVARIFEAARGKARGQKNLLAPAAAIDAVEGVLTLPFEEGCRQERVIFERLLVSDQAKALIHIFLAERAAGKDPAGKTQAPPAPIRAAAVVGAGTMGRGIAMCFANAGIPVRLIETQQAALDNAMKAVRRIYESSAAKGRITQEELKTRLNAIQPQLGYEGFDQVDVVVEAVFEDMAAKHDVFKTLEHVTKPGAILATNTSYLNIDTIAEALSSPERIIGLHFFSPANVMRLMEIVPGRVTKPEVLASARALSKKLGKLSVVAGNCPGFIGNRILRAYRREAQLLLEEGASPRQVDQALEGWGMAMGPFAVQDLAGIDIAMRSRHVFEAIDPPGIRVPRVIEKLYAQGRFGQKTGAGWYQYGENGKPAVDPQVDAWIQEASKEAGVTRREILPSEIIERTIYAMVLEGARILDEGYANRASDIDVVYVNGYGFPAYRGGPLHYADSIGLARVRQRINEFRQQHGPAWNAPPLIDRLVEGESTFADWDSLAEDLL